MKYWKGENIQKLAENEIFVFGSNPEGRHGAGAAKAAMNFGAKFGIGRGLEGSTYALVTKSLKAGYTESKTGITYDKEGYLSVSPEQISDNINELYKVAQENPEKSFLICYQYQTWPNGSQKKSLNGYTSQEILELFILNKEIPSNIVFHESYEPHINKILNLKDENKMNNKIENKEKEYTFFFHLSSPFSNFHPAKFEYKGLTFISNEQFMMYSKAKSFNDEVAAQKILDFNNTNTLARNFITGEVTSEEIIKDSNLSKNWNSLMMDIKKVGRTVKNYDDAYWESRRYKVVLFGVKLKFSQNQSLKDILMNTGTTTMVEASPYDKIWGIGLSSTDAKKIPEEKWPGRNLLGKILDEVKIQFASELNTNLQTVEKSKEESGIEVVNFYKVGKTIPNDGVYIGRANKSLNLTQSKFANPFPMREQTEEERKRVVEEYRKWIWEEVKKGNINKEEILSLKNKKLVCYCAPKSCHGDILKSLVEYVINYEAEFDNKIKATNKLKVKIL